MRKNIRRDSLILSGIVLWILFVLGGYYYYHKPITIEMINAPAGGLLDLVLAFWFAGLSGGLGRRFLRAETVSPLERAILQFALGSGIIGLAWFGVSLLGLLRFPVGLPLMLAGTVIVFRDSLAWSGEFRALGKGWQETHTVEKLLVLIAAGLLFFQLQVALAPPIKWDALAYHLQLPRQYLAAGRFVFTPENPYWGHPQLVEMLYTLAMSIHRAETAAVLGWSAGLLSLVGVFGFASAQATRLERGNPGASAGWVAVAAVVAGTTFRYLLGWSYTEPFAILYGLSALIAVFQGLNTHRRGWFLWACLFCGLAIGTKWTAGVLAAGIYLVMLVFFRHSGITLKELFLKQWLPGGAIVFSITLPWLAKNLIATGNPIFPYFIGTPWFDAARLTSANPLGEAIQWWLHLLLPVSATWTGIDSAPGFSADLGPLLLLLSAIGLWAYRRDPGVQAAALVTVPAALAMGLASLRFGHLMQTRLYYALLPAAALLAGLGWVWCQQVILGVRLRRVMAAVLLLVLGLAFWQDSQWIGTITPGRVVLGTQTRQSYLENTLGYHILAMQTIAGLPGDSRILMLWEPRGFYAPLNAQADLWIDRWRTDRRELATAPAILDRWKAQGYTHLLVYQAGVELIRPLAGESPGEDWIVLQETLQRLPPPTAIGDAYYLYDLK